MSIPYRDSLEAVRRQIEENHAHADEATKRIGPLRGLLLEKDDAHALRKLEKRIERCREEGEKVETAEGGRAIAEQLAIATGEAETLFARTVAAFEDRPDPAHQLLPDELLGDPRRLGELLAARLEAEADVSGGAARATVMEGATPIHLTAFAGRGPFYWCRAAIAVPRRLPELGASISFDLVNAAVANLFDIGVGHPRVDSLYQIHGSRPLAEVLLARDVCDALAELENAIPTLTVGNGFLNLVCGADHIEEVRLPFPRAAERAIRRLAKIVAAG